MANSGDRDRAIWAEAALLPGGWSGPVRVSLIGGKIGEVVAAARPEPEDARADILLPALANLHSHAFQRALAGLGERRGPGADSFWTWRTLMYQFLERITPDQLEAIAAQVYLEMLEAGYASVGEFHYLHHGPGGTPYASPAEMAHRIAAAAEATGIGLTLLPVLYMQGGMDGRALSGGQLRFGCSLDAFARLIADAEPTFREVGNARALGVAPHSLRAVPEPALAEVAALRPADPVHIHVAEQVAEVAEVEAATGARPVAWALANLPIDQRWCLIHATQMTPAETDGLAASGAVAGLCPLTEANLGDGTFDGVRYLSAGGVLGVGCDSNTRISLAEELRQLDYSQRLRDLARGVLAGPGQSPGRQLYTCAARGGAQALGLGDRAGTIAPGAPADLLGLDKTAMCLAAREGDAWLDGWIFAGSDQGTVRDVWSGGRHLVREGRHPRRDEIGGRFRRVLSELLGA